MSIFTAKEPCPRCQKLELQNDQLLKRLLKMTELVGELRLAGADKPEPKPVLKTQQPSRIEQAIRRKTGRNAALARHLREQATEFEQQGLPEEQIITRVTEWNGDDDEESES